VWQCRQVVQRRPRDTKRVRFVTEDQLLRGRVDRKQLLVVGAVMGGAEDESITRIIAPPVPVGLQIALPSESMRPQMSQRKTTTRSPWLRSARASSFISAPQQLIT
jgi:hypothetical protein